jgi:hypothetical protein
MTIVTTAVKIQNNLKPFIPTEVTRLFTDSVTFTASFAFEPE